MRAFAAAVLAGAAVLVGAAPAVAAPPPASEHVVIVGIAGLSWDDVSAASTPELARLARAGSIGSLSVRAAPGVTCPAEGWLTLGAGTYAAVQDPADIDPDSGCGPRQPPRVEPDGQGARIPDMVRIAELNDELRFGATPGELIGSAGLACSTGVGPGGALAVADPSGVVQRYSAELPADPADLLASCPLTVVDLGGLPGGRDRGRALKVADSAIRAIASSRPDRTTLIVVGIGETQARQQHLHPIVAEGPDFRGGWLWSQSTRRVPYAQLSDVGPTALRALGQRDLPERIAGRALVGGAEGRPKSLAAAAAALVDTDTAAVQQRGVLGWFFAGFGVLSLLVYGALGWLLWRRRTGGQVPDATMQRLGVAALGLAAVPAATFVANLVPWWRMSVPLLGLTAAVLAAVVATLLIAYGGPWRRTPSGPVAAVAAVAVTVAALDALTGTTLQINSMLGYNPLVAGRFFGFGNIAAAAFGAAVMMLTAFLADGRPRLKAGLVVVAIAVPTIALDGFPGWGADFGGVLTFVPAFAILALLVTRSRLSALRFGLAAGAGVLVVALIGIADYLREASERSHFGRFVAAVLDGSAGDTVYRKLRTSIDLVLMGAHTMAALVLVVLLIVLVFRPVATLRQTYERVPALRIALVAVVVMAVIGGVTNDSSVAIPLVAALVAGPAAFALCARVSTRPGEPASRDTPMPGVTEPAQVLP